MKLQAIIGAGIGFFDNHIDPKNVAEHIIGLPFIKNISSKDTIVCFTDSVKIDELIGDKEGKNFYISMSVEDPQGIYREISEKGYTLIASKITQDCKLKQGINA